MSGLHTVLHKSREAFTYFLYFCSCLFPRSKNIWTFIGWHIGPGIEVFADNTKYLYLHVANTVPNIRAVWLAKDKEFASLLRSRGYRSYYQYSLLGIWSALRAGTTVIDAFLQPENFRWTGRTRLVQLLHGKGMKAGGYGQKPLHAQQYIFTTSPFVNTMLPEIFVEKTPMLVAGYSRADVFFKEMPGSEIGVDKKTKAILDDPKYTKRFLYAPTFRRGDKTLDLSHFIDMTAMSEWLVKNNYLLLMSLHPKYRDQARDISYPNIHFVEDSDVYPLLPSIDILINDYSSIFTDYLLLDRPIIFYPYDLKEYMVSPGLTFDSYDTYTPGPKAYNFEELIQTLEKTIAHDDHVADRKRVRDLYHTYQDGNSSERIMKILRP